MRTAIVILNWNTATYLSRFLPPLQNSLSEGDEIVVIDNASTDNSVEVLEKDFPNISRIVLNKNFGFTGGYNKGLAQLEKEKYDYYILLNTDIEVDKNWLKPLQKYMEAHPHCAACGPKILSYNQKDTFEYAGAAGGYLDKFGFPFCQGRVMQYLEKDKGQYNEAKNVFWMSGACLMIRAELWHKFEGLDDRFFAHFEEIDFCWRLQLHGWAISYVPESKIYHIGGGTLANNSPWKLELNFRNNLLTLYKNLAKTYALYYLEKGYSKKQATYKAYHFANFRLFQRRVLDGVAAICFLLKGQLNFVKAVWKAHTQVRKLVQKPSESEILEFLEQNPHAKVRGFYNKWIVLQALRYRENVFNKIDFK